MISAHVKAIADISLSLTQLQRQIGDHPVGLYDCYPEKHHRPSMPYI